jgi:hypothetical protein
MLETGQRTGSTATRLQTNLKVFSRATADEVIGIGLDPLVSALETA